MVTEKATESHHVELEIRPLHGQCFRIDPWSCERTGEFVWQGIAKVRWAERKSLAFVVTAGTKEEDHEGTKKELWQSRMRSAAVASLKIGALSAFEENDLTYEIPKRVLSKGGAAKVRVSEARLRKMEEEYEHDRLARKSFRHAVARMRAYALSPPYPGYASDATTMFDFIVRCVDVGYTEFLYQWYREKVSGIRTQMAEITRRKDRNHHGFRYAQDYIRQNIFSFRPPDAWVDRPPVLNLDPYED